MVGRLVQQDQVGVLQQDLGQLDAHAPAAAELGGLPVEVAPCEPQSQERLLHRGVVVDLLDAVELLAESRYLLDELHVLVRLIVGTHRQFMVDAFHLLLQLVDV